MGYVGIGLGGFAIIACIGLFFKNKKKAKEQEEVIQSLQVRINDLMVEVRELKQEIKNKK